MPAELVYLLYTVSKILVLFVILEVRWSAAQIHVPK